MKAFFEVKTIDTVLTLVDSFEKMDTEVLDTRESLQRILAEDIRSDIDIPDFHRSTMDGYAIRASSSFGSSESNPVYLNLKGSIKMGTFPAFCINDGEAAQISTGGALPEGSNCVIMVEHTSIIGDSSIEIYKSLAPGSNIIYRGEDVKKNNISIAAGTKIRPQETGLIAASGKSKIRVFRKPIVAIISTGNEIIPANKKPTTGQVRDINSYTLASQILDTGGIPKVYEIIPDQFDPLKKVCISALENSDIVIISGGSSLGKKDLTLAVLESIKSIEVLVHGISISPGKPTILAKYHKKQIWGLPGHAASAMVVFKVITKKFLEKIAGLSQHNQLISTTRAILNRNISSSNGRVDYIRVNLIKNQDGILLAEPILGKSGLISTMVKADGLIEIGVNSEGIYKNTPVEVIFL